MYQYTVGGRACGRSIGQLILALSMQRAGHTIRVFVKDKDGWDMAVKMGIQPSNIVMESERGGVGHEQNFVS